MGRGVVADKVLQTGEYVCEYRGEVIPAAEGYRRESLAKDNGPSYLYYFKFKGQELW